MKGLGQKLDSIEEMRLPKYTSSSALPLSFDTHFISSMHLLGLISTLAVILSSSVSVATTESRSLDNASVQHFTITRRGGKFEPTIFGSDFVNLTYLGQELERIERRFNLTKREVQGNKLIRKARKDDSSVKDLTKQVAMEGIWYTYLI